MNVGDDIAYIVRSSPVRLLQSIYEIQQLLYVYLQLHPKYVLEIGIGAGGSLKLWMNVAPDDACIIAIDMNADGNSIMSKYKKPSQSAHFINGDSRHGPTRDRVTDILDGILLDFIFVDGDHSYNGVRGDYDTYYPLLRDGGIMAFHDLPAEGPWKLWGKVSSGHICREIYDPNSGDGIGIIYKGMNLTVPHI